jgi:hypothetical protein
VPESARVKVFIEKEIFMPTGSRCCPRHIFNGELNSEALDQLRQTYHFSNVNRTTVVGVLKQTRDVAIQHMYTRLNFDDQNAFNSEDYYNLTGLTKEQFDELMTCMSYTDSMRASKTRTTRTCIALLLTKLRCGLSNQLLATLFGMKKWQVCNVQ